MLYRGILNKYRSLRKQSFLNTLGTYRKKYAFIGVGQHSLQNLYPCIQHLNVPLKFIYSHTLVNAEKLSSIFPGCIPTDDIRQILEDSEVNGVFISLRPEHQFQTLLAALKHKKNVFVEKPPCQTYSEMEQIVSLQNDLICFTGLQRRFSTVHKLIKRNHLLAHAETYNYIFRTGSYPEGNTETELFIHPVDHIIQLFGEINSLKIQAIRKDNGVTYQLLAQHSNGISGMIELSTRFSWNAISETIDINSSRRVVTVNYPYELYTTEKSNFLSIPIEKITKAPLTKKIYFNQNDFSTNSEKNTLIVQGFYTEIRHFLSMTESGKNDECGDPKSLLQVYKILEQLQNTR